MKPTVLVVYCHPNPKSFTAAVLHEVLGGLQDAQCDYHFVDLYADNFNPVLVVDETRRRRDLDTVTETARYREQLASCSSVVFVYPVWWGGFPAMLKGYIDRIFVSGLAYSFATRPKNAVFPHGLMRGKAAHFFYTLDSPRILAIFDPGWFSNYFTVFRYCGFSEVKRYYRHRLKATTDNERRAWLVTVRSSAKSIGQRNAPKPA